MFCDIVPSLWKILPQKNVGKNWISLCTWKEARLTQMLVCAEKSCPSGCTMPQFKLSTQYTGLSVVRSPLSTGRTVGPVYVVQLSTMLSLFHSMTSMEESFANCLYQIHHFLFVVVFLKVHGSRKKIITRHNFFLSSCNCLLTGLL